VTVQAKSVVTFKPGKEMEARVRDYVPPAEPPTTNTTDSDEADQPAQG